MPIWLKATFTNKDSFVQYLELKLILIVLVKENNTFSCRKICIKHKLCQKHKFNFSVSF